MNQRCEQCGQPVEGKRPLCEACVEDSGEAVSIYVTTEYTCPVCGQMYEEEGVVRGMVQCDKCKSHFRLSNLY